MVSFRSIFVVVTVAAGQYCGKAWAQEPPRGPDITDQDREAMERVRPRQRKAQLALPLIENIQLRDLYAFAKLCGLAPEQITFAEIQYQEYIDRAQAIRSEVESRLAARSGEFAEILNGADAAVYTANLSEILRLYDDALHLRETLWQEELRFFMMVESVITEEQRRAWRQCRFTRQRDRCGRTGMNFPSLKVDLSKLVLVASASDEPFESVDLESWETFWQQYDLSITPMMERFHAEYFKAGPKASAAHLAAIEAAEYDREEMITLRAEAHALREGYVKLSRRIHDLNATAAGDAEQLLRPEHRSRWHKETQRALYPEIFPRMFDLDPFVQPVLRRENLEDEHRKVLTETMEALELRLGQIERQMIDRLLNWQMQLNIARGYSHEDFRAYADEMIGFQRDRLQAWADAVESLREVDPEAAERAEAELKAAEEAWARRLEPETHFMDQWPKP